jgi:hypothetical protein
MLALLISHTLIFLAQKCRQRVFERTFDIDEFNEARKMEIN